jgi:sec-independent protein translocase protein TatA
MGFSFSHLLLLLLIIFVIFGAGKLPKVMGDIGKGVRNLREGLKGEDEIAASRQLGHSPEPTAARQEHKDSAING